MVPNHLPNPGRRRFVAAAAAASAVAAFPSGAATPTLPPRRQFAIRGAYVMTMDAALGDLPSADVLVRDGRIVAIGDQLDLRGMPTLVGAGMLVLPGLVDTHTHFWTTQMRGQFGDTPQARYFLTRNRLAEGYTPEDMYHGTRLGAAEAIHAGITTALDFCHNVRSLEFAQECVRALAETGLRTRYLYGASTITTPTQSIDLQALEKMHRDWKVLAGDAPLTLGLGWRGPLGTSTISHDRPTPALAVAKDEFEAARRMGLPISVHVSGIAAQDQFDRLAAGGFLAPDLQLIHMSNATPAQLKLAAQAGSSISLTPVTELRVGYGLTQLADYLESGARIGLGIDSNALAGSADMFQVMRLFQGLEAGRKKNELAVPARRLLELATIDGARSLGMDKDIGSIVPGKRADLIMVDTRALNLGMLPADPSHLLVEAARPENVDTVIVDGRILKRNGRLTALDSRLVLAQARQSFERVLRRVRG